ncbi:MAG TPA: hypothetical protein VHK90_09620 [Thermoanaerobaculia bacterium]|nr:hypothetical protein [Thermoanaerobaculia bacterium]
MRDVAHGVGHAAEEAAIVGGVKDVHNNLTIDPGFFSRMADAVRDVTHR